MDIQRAHRTHVALRPSFAAGRPTTSRTSSFNSTASSHSRDPMPIPGRVLDEPPPPLPPPQYNEELDRGIDAAWTWSNSHGRHQGSMRELAPIKPGSSLFGGYMQDRARAHPADVDDMDTDNWTRREHHRVTRALRSSPPHEIAASAGGGICRDPSISSGRTTISDRQPTSPATSHHRLGSDKPLAQVNFNRSSHAYDQSLLSKIGKPNSPPRRGSDSTDTVPPTSRLSLQTRTPTFHVTSNANETGIRSTETMQWPGSPMSLAYTPASESARDTFNYRNPPGEESTTCLVLDPELFVPSTTADRRSSNVPSTSVDSTSIASRSQRNSYDHSMFGLDDQESATDHYRLLRQEPRHGMKRRAHSPPPDGLRDEKSPTLYTENLSKTHAHLARSPAMGARTYASYGSVSSTASSLKQASHPSSFAPSIATSSMTSTSSFDKPSPSEPSPLSQQITSAGPVSSPAMLVAPPWRGQARDQAQDSNSIAHKMSIQTAIHEPRHPPSIKSGNHYMCECCPKKPKKFDTEEELRSHQMEKQYACLYCNNRFKNKNEAERHQNSLHLRRHSWSCAAIPSYQAVFQPSPNTPSQEADGHLMDACGFCGEEFPNRPEPDWDRRIEHLTNTHKFGECNQAKKFYRADHFRQHLKHSHAGQSGKWTSTLENVCLREETPLDSTGMSPTASEAGGQGRGPSSLPAPADTPMGGATIDEARDES